MKSFSSILITHAFDSKEDKDSFFQERYDMQNADIEIIDERYLGPVEDVDDLRAAMDGLIEAQTKACNYADNHSAYELSLIHI